MGGRLRRPLPHSAKPNAARRALPPLAARAKRGVCRGAGGVGGIESRGVRELPHTAAFSMPNFPNCTAKRRVNLTPQNRERHKIGDLSYPRRPARRVGCPLPHSAKPNAARRALPHLLLVRNAAFVGGREESGELKAAGSCLPRGFQFI